MRAVYFMFLLAISATALSVAKAPPATIAPEVVTIAGESFMLDVAADDDACAVGLKGRPGIEVSGGMIFLYRLPAIRSFWMAECKVDIDVLFLDSTGRIVAKHEMKAEAPREAGESVASYESRLKRYSSNRPMQFAIELRAGSIDRLKLKVGQKIALETDRLVKLAK